MDCVKNIEAVYSSRVRSVSRLMRAGLLGLCVALLGSALSTGRDAIAQSITYTYDEAGRLRSVTNATGETAEYVYDAAGNLTQVRRSAAGVPIVSDFSPDSGPAGTMVTITGANFSPTAGGNTVRFNGTPATVNSASGTQLIASVPFNATTGPVSVETAAGTGTSLQSFTVGGTAPNDAPRITSVNPLVGRPGTLVTVEGINFNPAPGQTRLVLNGSVIQAQSIAGTRITFRVPDFTGSGSIRVITPSGTAVSSTDLVIPPPGDEYAVAASAGPSIRTTIGGGTTAISLSAASYTSRWVAILFDAAGGAAISLDFNDPFTQTAGSRLIWEVRNVRNEVMTSTSFDLQFTGGPATSRDLSTDNRTIHVPPTSSGGTHALFIRLVAGPTDATFGGVVQAKLDQELSPGTPTSRSFASLFRGQSFRFVFRRLNGDNLGFSVGNLSTSPSTGGDVKVGFRTENWQQVRDTGGGALEISCASACDLTAIDDRFVAATDPAHVSPRFLSQGLHSLIIRPSYGPSVTSVAGAVCSSTDMVLPPFGFSSPDPNEIRVGGFPTPPHPKALVCGQNGRFPVEVRPGERIGVTVSNQAFSSGSAELALIAPDGTVVPKTRFTTAQRLASEFPRSLAGGTHSLFVSPSRGEGGTVTLRVWRPYEASIQIDGPSVSVPLNFKGQTGRIRFTTSTTRSLGLGISNVANTPSSQAAASTISVIDAASELPVSSRSTISCGPANPGQRCKVDLQALPPGTYEIVVSPNPALDRLSLTLWLSSDVLGTLPLNTTTSMNLQRIGQNGRFTFSGTAGQQLGIAFMSPSFTSGQPCTVAVYRADGVTQIATWSVPGVAGSPPAVRDFPIALPATEPYQVFVSPNNGATGSLSLRLSQDVVGSLSIDGPTVKGATSGLGQTARYTFSVPASGLNLGLGLSGLTHTPAGGTTILKIIAADNSPVDAVPCSDASPKSCALNLFNLPAGAYAAIVEPPPGATASQFSLTLSTDLVASLAVNASTATTLNVNRHGRDARPTFVGTARQNLTVRISGLTMTPLLPVVVRVLRPSDGWLVYSFTLSTASSNNVLANLPETGTYTMWFDQGLGLTYSLGVRVTSP